ncbi:uncharacterized protein BT62DRAFT_1078066 [Guyanagaster necrorhizus]|uniref:Uncharacterized protein n=1 Tax=Guyanagaster necrorhizus TaxID=856835 RepID=A0A9P7VMC9_9AGAR|nr:uncharacterized protein BT62DRAFT_1078066 [Guyanagaster necrorhizus MCA 3950]KAG7443866.1 hypothetical protein BT62DRAFT_1078066 [Guyanagaster necrorhizus MCA 3950]
MIYMIQNMQVSSFSPQNTSVRSGTETNDSFKAGTEDLPSVCNEVTLDLGQKELLLVEMDNRWKEDACDLTALKGILFVVDLIAYDQLSPEHFNVMGNAMREWKFINNSQLFKHVPLEFDGVPGIGDAQAGHEYFMDCFARLAITTFGRHGDRRIYIHTASDTDASGLRALLGAISGIVDDYLVSISPSLTDSSDHKRHAEYKPEIHD